jgi:DNA-binding winged helix-turn-helix (wHTH) protein/tetratricopeptide (TPR) repeat protein
MRTRLGRFELDEAGRTLRVDGQERPLQPLVFDLLVYLVAHRGRVISKDELFSKLWSGVVVSESSLQRAISVLRGVLRDGGLADAIQTFARRGYCFSAEETPAGPVATPTRPQPTLEGRALADAGDWSRALTEFEAAAANAVFSAEDLEAWGNAAICAGRPERAVSPLERAVAAFEEQAALESAARVALLLTNAKLESRELAIAKGWHARARSYLVGLPEGKQHGMAEWLAGRIALFEGDLDDCIARARGAMQIAERVGDPDLQCLGLVYSGHVLIAQGHVRQGLALHDEAGAAALAGRASTWASGIVFCSVIWAYLHLGDHHRAGQWTNEFSRWCERFPAYAFPALCRLHVGEVLSARGELTSAEREINRAREQLALSGPYAEGDACRVLGDIRLMRGELDSAEAAFRDAHRVGWSPQPGFALLLAARGEGEAAIRQLEGALKHPGWADGQRRPTLLAVLARIAAMSGRQDRARTALNELAALDESSVTRASSAEAARARAELAWVEGEAQKAESFLRVSIAQWLEAGARVHAAHARLRLCEMLLDSGDLAAAELELSAAQSVFHEVGAEALLQTCDGLRAQLS